MTNWEPLARELLWARLLDKTDRVNELATILAVDVRDGQNPTDADVRRLRAAIDDLEMTLDAHVSPLTATTQRDVDANVERTLGD